MGTGKKDTKVLIVDDAENVCRTISNLLHHNGFEALTIQDGNKALEVVSRVLPDVILLDLKMPGISGIDVLKKIKKMYPEITVIIITAYGEIKSAVEAVKFGAYDYINKPFDNNELLITLRRAISDYKQKREINHLRSKLGEITPLPELMGPSSGVEKLYEQVKCVAPTDFTVVLYGETGSGKELVARAIHNHSLRRSGNYVAVDCGSIPETLIESELFGYEKGAFTGAGTTRQGYFERASGGTLFLDEIGNLSKPMQTKLLRALQERRIQRVGGRDFIYNDIRVIVACNERLEDLVKLARFRLDLYHRLNEFFIEIPPLRKRETDIVFLCKCFVDATNVELGKHVQGVSTTAMELLRAYDWPGNVRELKNVIKRAVLLADDLIEPKHIQNFIASCARTNLSHAEHGNEIIPKDAEKKAPRNRRSFPDIGFSKGLSLKKIIKKSVNDIEKRIIIEALIRTGGNKSKAAKMLSVDYKTLYNKVKHHNINIKKDAFLSSKNHVTTNVSCFDPEHYTNEEEER